MPRRLARIPLIKRFIEDRRGIALLEFSFLAPILIFGFFGTLEISQAYAAKRKAAVAARAIGDLVSRVDQIDDTELKNVFDAAARIIEPFDPARAELRITSILIDSNGVAKVDWSKAQNTTASTSGQVVTLPAALVVKDTSLIAASVCVGYSSIIGYFITGWHCYGEDGWFRPRISARVTKV